MRAEEARRAAEQAAAAARRVEADGAATADAPRPKSAAPAQSDAVTVPTPVVTPTNASGGPVEDHGGYCGRCGTRSMLGTLPSRGTTGVAPRDDTRGGRGDDGRASEASAPESESEVTTELPMPPVPPGAADETAVLPAVDPRAADETAVLPPVTPGAADETAVLPPYAGTTPPTGSRRATSGRRVRPLAPDRSEESRDRTRELPQIDPDQAPPRRRRSDWAEETPLDDLPTLAGRTARPA